MDAVRQMGEIVKRTAELTKEKDGLGCAKLVVFANAVEDNPFMAGAFHGVGESDTVINVGVSGPGVVKHALENIPDANLNDAAEMIKRTAFKITRAGQLIAKEAAKRLGAEFGIVDLSLAPTPVMIRSHIFWRNWVLSASADTAPRLLWLCSTMPLKRAELWQVRTSGGFPAHLFRSAKISA